MKKMHNLSLSSGIKKILLIMKLTTFIWLMSVMQVSAGVYYQKGQVSINLINTSIEQVMDAIKHQIGYKFVYRADLFNEVEKFDLHAKNKPIANVLTEVLVARGFEYEILDNTIIVRKAREFSAISNQQEEKKVTITGVVKDAKGAPVPFAAIRVKGTTIGTMSDADGHYSLQFVQIENPVLEISSLGYDKVEIVYTGQSELNPVLKESSQGLDEVVVVAYGTRKKGTIAGSVSTIKAEKMESVPAAGFDQALQGSTPGLTVMSSSGEPSKAATFQIRGTNSINSGTSPLFILDGVPISSTDFNTISPGDIESVSVLKDASSTSIYGARAANGVVVITTKRGQSGNGAKFSFRTQQGVSRL